MRERASGLSGPHALLLQFPQNAFPILLVERLCFSHGGEDRLGARRVMPMAFQFRDQGQLLGKVRFALRYVSLHFSQMT